MKQDSENLESSPLIMFGAAKTSYLLGGGQGGDGTAYDGPFQFDSEKEKIVNCKLMFGRRTLSCGDVDCTKDQFESSSIYAVISHSGSGEPTLSVEISSSSSDKEPTLYTTYRLLYESKAANDGGTSANSNNDQKRIVIDYRFMPFIAALE